MKYVHITYGYLKKHYPKIAVECKRHSDSWLTEDMKVDESFTWDMTEQGWVFWNAVNEGKFDVAKKDNPKMFDTLSVILKKL